MGSAINSMVGFIFLMFIKFKAGISQVPVYKIEIKRNVKAVLASFLIFFSLRTILFVQYIFLGLIYKIICMWINDFFVCLCLFKTSLLRRLRTDPSLCNSAYRQNPLIKQSCCNFWTNYDVLDVLDVLGNLEFPRLVLFYDWKHHF